MHNITIQYTCPSITGDQIHSVTIEDNDLLDTWDSVTVGEVPADLKAIGCTYTHDINPFADGIGEWLPLSVSLYPFFYDVDRDDKIGVDMSDGIPCVVISVEGDPLIEKRVVDGVEQYGYSEGAFSR